MAQKSRELTTFPEDQSLTLSPHVRQLTSASTPALGSLTPSSGLHRHLHVHVSAHIDVDIYTYMKIMFKNLRTFCC